MTRTVIPIQVNDGIMDGLGAIASVPIAEIILRRGESHSNRINTHCVRFPYVVNGPHSVLWVILGQGDHSFKNGSQLDAKLKKTALA